MIVVIPQIKGGDIYVLIKELVVYESFELKEGWTC